MITAILNKTVLLAMDGKFEPFKATPIFDSTAAHAEWLGYNAAGLSLKVAASTIQNNSIS